MSRARIVIVPPAGEPSPPPGEFYELPADRAQVYSPGVTYNGGIPNRTTVFTTISASTYGNGASEASAGIQAALDACPAGQVVALSSGTFLCNNHVTIKTGITLRGATPTATTQQTILSKTNGAVYGSDHHGEESEEIIRVTPDSWNGTTGSTSTNLTANGAKGDMSITVASASGFAAGQFVLIDCNEYDACDWKTLPWRNGSPNAYTIWANDRIVYKRHNPTMEFIDDPFPPGEDSSAWFSRSKRPYTEIKEIASVVGNVITFTKPLRGSHPTSKTAQCTRFSVAMVQGAGIENLRCTGGADGNIVFSGAANCWVKNCELDIWYGEAVKMSHCYQVETRDSYIHDAAFASPGGIAYAWSSAFGTSECLLENCIIQYANKMMVGRSSGAGNVIGYNFCDNGWIVYATEFQEVGINGSHMVGGFGWLFEGNYSFNYDADNTHGNAIYMVAYRNYLTGVRAGFGTDSSNNSSRCIGLNYGSYWHSCVANVLGISGAMSGRVFENLGTGGVGDPFGGTGGSVYMLGYQSSEWDQAVDTEVISTLLRDGNYDYKTDVVRWQGIGGTGTGYTTPPAVSAMRDSWYCPSKPSFFGSDTWPWVDAQGSTKVYTLPAKARYDSGNYFYT